MFTTICKDSGCNRVNSRSYVIHEILWTVKESIKEPSGLHFLESFVSFHGGPCTNKIVQQLAMQFESIAISNKSRHFVEPHPDEQRATYTREQRIRPIGELTYSSPPNVRVGRQE